ncbi:hypothetical protein FQR65_LT12913 [Abscondita terminalis]|nr:hypothetical protein FQR65_LT12913 [Abscondita terminalis]
MPLLSKLKPLLLKPSILSNAVNRNAGHHRVLPYAPSRWHWRKFKDYVHFYVMIGVMPLAAITAYANIFIGPATLSEIPKDYEPKYWEYYRSPITRFLAKNFMTDPQQQYEKYLHHLYEEREKQILRKLESEVKQKVAERRDYQAYYYTPVLSKYHRVIRESADYAESIRGD